MTRAKKPQGRALIDYYKQLLTEKNRQIKKLEQEKEVLLKASLKQAERNYEMRFQLEKRETFKNPPEKRA